jgi:hypothetical protein
LVQVGAVVICTTVPSLVLSATSTENNLFAASFCICLVYVLLALSPLRDWWSFALFGALAASLAYLSKGTAVVLIGPVAIALVIFRVATESNYSSRVRLRAWLQIAGVALLAGLVVAGPFLYQDQSLFGSPDGPDAQAVLSTDLTWRAAGGDIVRTIAANFMMGNGTNGPETAVSKFLLGKFHRVYDAFGVPQDDPDYFVGQDTQDYFDAFGVRNFTVWDRSEDEGADPLDVILLCFASVSTVILLIRGDRRMRVVVLIALGLTVGFLILAGISRWQIYEVRFFIPLFVAWSPIIAIALFRCSPWLLRAIMVLLVVASLPQLLDNSERPVMQNSYGHNPLAPYFLNPRLAARSVVSNDRSYITTTAADFEKFSKIVAESTCKRLGIGNFLVFEYPVWVGLHEDGWRGEIQDVNVDNVTGRYEDTGFHPCAVITQPMWPYAGTDPTMVQIGFGPKLALSISPQDLQRVNVPIQGFSSRAPGVRVFPGSGWRFGTSVTLTGVGTLLVSSATTRTVDLQVDGPGGARAGIGITATTPGTHVGTVTTTNGSGLAQVKLAAGVTSIQLADVPAPGHSTGVDGVTLEDTAQTAGS